MKDEALRMALEALESCDQVYGSEGSYQYFSQSMVDKAITAIQQALAAPVQEPHKSLSEHLAQATNGRVYVDPVTGDVGIGTPAAQQEPMEVDQATMELAESVGLIGPASRTHDLHAAIQRFHDLICVNATIKAAKMAADAIRESTPPAAQPAPVPLTDGVTVPMAVLEAAEASLGSFCSDHGWSDEDMQNMDNLSAYIARHKANLGITKGQP
jgi:hypothetical protein